jgi:hypothetical protein
MFFEVVLLVVREFEPVAILSVRSPYDAGVSNDGF